MSSISAWEDEPEPAIQDCQDALVQRMISRCVKGQSLQLLLFDIKIKKVQAEAFLEQSL